MSGDRHVDTEEKRDNNVILFKYISMERNI